MDSVRHKMETMVQEKTKALQQAEIFEEQKSAFEQNIDDYKNKVSKLEREISKAEQDLDDALTLTKERLELLETQEKTAADGELAVIALERKIKLIEEENERVNAKLKENHKRIAEEEARFENEERDRKRYDTTCLAAEDRFEIQEVQLSDAQYIAEEAGRKFEEIERKLKMVCTELERVTDRADEFEKQCAQHEIEIKDNSEKLRKMEVVAGENSEKEDHLEVQIKELDANNKIMESKAEFGERSVEKLEQTIDSLEEHLMGEKSSYQQLSLKLDETMTDMLALTEDQFSC